LSIGALAIVRKQLAFDTTPPMLFHGDFRRHWAYACPVKPIGASQID
jgi:hypothetical protein